MKRPSVTDHAVIRYLERVVGLDVDRLRRHIGRSVALAAEHPDATAVLLGGHRYLVVDGRVITIEVGARPDRRTGRVRRERCEDAPVPDVPAVHGWRTRLDAFDDLSDGERD